jgi:hypothetical protein
MPFFMRPVINSQNSAKAQQQPQPATTVQPFMSHDVFTPSPSATKSYNKTPLFRSGGDIWNTQTGSQMVKEFHFPSNATEQELWQTVGIFCRAFSPRAESQDDRNYLIAASSERASLEYLCQLFGISENVIGHRKSKTPKGKPLDKFEVYVSKETQLNSQANKALKEFKTKIHPAVKKITLNDLNMFAKKLLYEPAEANEDKGLTERRKWMLKAIIASEITGSYSNSSRGGQPLMKVNRLQIATHDNEHYEQYLTIILKAIEPQCTLEKASSARDSDHYLYIKGGKGAWADLMEKLNKEVTIVHPASFKFHLDRTLVYAGRNTENLG